MEAKTVDGRMDDEIGDAQVSSDQSLEQASVRWLLLISIGFYIALGTLIGLVQGGLPPVLRQRGAEIASLGWVYALALPFGVTFLWAPAVDRLKLPGLPHRTAWMIYGQLIAIIGLVVVAVGEDFPLAWLFLIGLCVAVAIATADLALDALLSQHLPSRSRSGAGAIKVASLSFGSILGGGLFVGIIPFLGWRLTFGLVAAVLFLPLLAFPSVASVERSCREVAGLRPSFLRVFNSRRSWMRLWVLVLLAIGMMPLFALNRIMLVDLGLSPAEIGWTVGILSPLAGIAMPALAMIVLNRSGWSRAVGISGAIGAAAIAGIILGNIAADATIAAAGSILAYGAVCGIYTVCCASILGWAQGPQAATDYSALYGLSRLVGLVSVVGMSQIAAHLGWVAFFILVEGFLLFSLLVAIATIKHLHLYEHE